MSSTVRLRRSRAHPPACRPVARGLALLVALLALCVTPLRAEAAGLDAISDVRITTPSGDLRRGDSIRLEATWAVPDDAQPGDTFRLGLPTEPRIIGFSDTFDLADPDGNVVGTCTADETQIACTLGDYVTTHVDVTGTLFFWALITETSETETLVFSTGSGATLRVGIPGGVTEPEDGGRWLPPAHPVKGGWYDRADQVVWWSVYLPGDFLTDQRGEPVVLTDTFDSRLTLVEDSVALYVAPASAEDFFHAGSWLGPAEYAVETGPAGNQFRFSVPDALGADHVYLLAYATSVPDDARDGDRYENTVTGLADDDVVAHARYAGAGGSGDGSSTRSIRLTKRVDGSAAQDVTGPFEFTLECTDRQGTSLAGFPRTVDVSVDGTATFAQVPVGAVCELGETDSGADRVSFDPSGRLEVTERSPATIDVVATNTFDAHVGALTVTKHVTGPAAGLVPGSTGFTVEYAYDSAGGDVTGTLVVADGESAELADLPAGAVVTLSEAEPDPVPGAVWSEPVFTGDGVEQAADGTARVVIGDGTTVQVVLTNEVDAAAPPLGPEAHAGPALEPTPRGGLATTGTPVATAALVAVLLVMAGGVVAVAKRGWPRNGSSTVAPRSSKGGPSAVDVRMS